MAMSALRRISCAVTPSSGRSVTPLPASWTYLYELGPSAQTLPRYVDFKRIAQGEVGLVVTATDIVTGDIEDFTQRRRGRSDHASTTSIASGSLPPSYPPLTIGPDTYWDGGLFDNTPLGSLLRAHRPTERRAHARDRDQPLPRRRRGPATMLEVWDRMIELQFANKTEKDVSCARRSMRCCRSSSSCRS